MTFTETEPQVKLEELKRIEGKYDIELPPAYIEHMLNYNGGSCTPDVFSFIEDGQPSESRVHYFLAVNSGDDYDLESCINDLNGDDRVERNLIPIATDPFGNFILLSCRTVDFGALYFWDHENEFNENYIPVYLADNLKDFLTNLY
ncbi:SMI1/KNR4 family protein [Neolewinella antarctica]|uniref:Knr4/Smi1-like domain-containing protein n=1 Tax=Neolewinella antarctica TaxID=442734 RepID=A0ABX0XFE2_9BACT|nr:SMI1/KNR4 family protein [Neolewinella antarctica]NJC27498.1 hypothetical protein [Neolewinella antarctica]